LFRRVTWFIPTHIVTCFLVGKQLFLQMLLYWDVILSSTQLQLPMHVINIRTKLRYNAVLLMTSYKFYHTPCNEVRGLYLNQHVCRSVEPSYKLRIFIEISVFRIYFGLILQIYIEMKLGMIDYSNEFLRSNFSFIVFWVFFFNIWQSYGP
jgi:hypothetical protein